VERAAAMTGTTFPTNYLVRFGAGVDRDAAADRLRREFFDSTAYPTFAPTIVRTVARVAYCLACWPRSSSSWPWAPSSTGSWSCSGAAGGTSP
jgi:hypothetical protein